MKSVKHLKPWRKAYLIKMLPKSMLSKSPPKKFLTWIKNKEKYFKALEDNCSSKKRKLRESNIEALDKVVFQWFWSKRSQNNPIDINLIKEKAITYAKDLGYNNFYDCPGWLERWKKEGQSFKIMFIWVNVHETCIPSPSPKLTGFSFIKTFHEPYSSVLKKQNTAFANFPYFSSGRCPTISFSFFTQTTYLSTKFAGSPSVDKISPVFGVEILLHLWYPFTNESTLNFVITTIGISSCYVSFVKSIFVNKTFFYFFLFFLAFSHVFSLRWCYVNLVSTFVLRTTSFSRKYLGKAKPLRL